VLKGLIHSILQGTLLKKGHSSKKWMSLFLFAVRSTAVLALALMDRI